MLGSNAPLGGARPWAPRLLVPLVPAVLVPAMLFGAISMGLRVPAIGHPGGTTLHASADYSRALVDGVSPLRAPFIEGILGGVIEPAGTAPVDVFGPGPALDRGGAVPVVVEHALVNDDFGRAYPVRSLPFSARTNNAEATRQTGEPSCAPVGERTVWYRFRAPKDLGLIADTFGTDQPASVGVFSGGSLGRLSEVGCSTHHGGNAHVPFRALAGTVYHFQVASLGAANVVFSLRAQGVTAELLSPDQDLSVASIGGTHDGRWWTFSATSSDTARAAGCAGATVVADECVMQIYAYDFVTKRATLVSVAADGTPGDGLSIASTISEGGRHVVFWSTSTNLVRDDRNTCYVYQRPGQCPDVFVHDRDADGNGVLDETFPGARTTVRVSISSNGDEGDDHSGLGLVSADGRYVAFQSTASTLVASDHNGVGDAFVHDRDADGNGVFDETFRGARKTVRISVSSSGEESLENPLRALRLGPTLQQRDAMPLERGNHLLSMSPNGRFAIFRSAAPNLVEGDTNGVYDVFRRDLVAGTTTRINVSSSGLEANRGSRLHNWFPPAVSNDGRYAVFISDATNLVPNDTNGAEDLFLRDLLTGATTRMTEGWDGREAVEPIRPAQDVLTGGAALATAAVALGGDVYPASELYHAVSLDGRYVYFSSGAALVPEDDNNARDVYVRDLLRGTITLVSVSTDGEPGNASSNLTNPSMDGRVIGFWSSATNLTDEGSDSPAYGLRAGSFVRILSEGS